MSHAEARAAAGELDQILNDSNTNVLTVLGFLATQHTLVADAIIESMPSLAIGAGSGRAAVGTFGSASGRLAPAATRQPAAPGADQVAQDDTLGRAKSSILTDVPAAPENGASAILESQDGIVERDAGPSPLTNAAHLAELTDLAGSIFNQLTGPGHHRQAGGPVMNDDRHIKAAQTRRAKSWWRVTVLLALAGGPLRSAEVAACTSMTKRLATRELRAMLAENKVTRQGPRGAFRLLSIWPRVIRAAA